MAKILSHVWSIARGSVGGITYLAGPTGQIIARQRTAPVQPATIFQAFAKNAMDEASSAWEGLTDVVQQLWANYALTLVYAGATGNYSPTGRQAFMAGRQLQRYINTRGFVAPSFVTTAPATTGFLLPSDLDMLAPAAIGIGFGLQVTADPVDDTIVFVNVAGPFEKERHFWKGPWDPTQTSAAIVAAGVSTVLDHIGLVLGKFYFIRVKCVADDASPRVSAEFFLRGVAIETGP